MSFARNDCEDTKYTCTAWDGKGTPSHNLVKECPIDKTKCEYRVKKVKTDNW